MTEASAAIQEKISARRSAARVSESDVLKGFIGPAKRIWAGPFYLFGLLVTSTAMVLLPVCYVMLIALVGYGVYYHMRYDIIFFATYHIYGRLAVMLFIIGYLGPAAAGVITVLFMLKPIFVRFPEGPRPLTLDRSQEPLLYEYIDQLCATIRAPKPRKIVVNCQINAAAGFSPGILNFIRRDLTLTIGLPLVSTLDVRQLTGVIAHEMGHFSQRLGTRMSVVIRRINTWLARVVFERDEWDEWLVAACRDSDRVSIIFHLARMVVWLTRQVLRIFMYLSHVISCFMSRRMEFNADRYEIETAGSDAFETCTLRIRQVNMIWPSVLRELQFAWREERLPDNLPLLLAHRVDEAGAALAEAAQASINDERNRIFSTHPTNRARIRRARKYAASGVFQATGPATVLFANFKMIAHAVTLTLYRNDFGLEVQQSNLVPTAGLVKDHEQIKRADMALGRYFQNCVTMSKPMGLTAESLNDGDTPQQTLARLKAARSKFDEDYANFQPLYDRYRGLMMRRRRLPCAHAAARAGLRVSPRAFRLKEADRPAIEWEINECERQRDELSRTLASFDELQKTRFTTALKLARIPKVRDRAKLSEAQLARIPSLFAALVLLETIQTRLQRLESDHNSLLWVFKQASGQDLSQLHTFDAVVASLVERVHGALGDLRSDLAGTQYPFHVRDGAVINLAQFSIESVPARKDLNGLAGAAAAAVGKLSNCHVQILGVLAEICERVELVAGFKRLPDPPPLKHDEPPEDGQT